MGTMAFPGGLQNLYKDVLNHMYQGSGQVATTGACRGGTGRGSGRGNVSPPATGRPNSNGPNIGTGIHIASVIKVIGK